LLALPVARTENDWGQIGSIYKKWMSGLLAGSVVKILCTLPNITIQVLSFATADDPRPGEFSRDNTRLLAWLATVLKCTIFIGSSVASMETKTESKCSRWTFFTAVVSSAIAAGIQLLCIGYIVVLLSGISGLRALLATPQSVVVAASNGTYALHLPTGFFQGNMRLCDQAPVPWPPGFRCQRVLFPNPAFD